MEKSCKVCGSRFARPPRSSRKQWDARVFCSRRCGNTWKARQQTAYTGDWGVGETKGQRANYRYRVRTTANKWAEWWEQCRLREDLAELYVPPRVKFPSCSVKGHKPSRQFVSGSCRECGDTFTVHRGLWHGSQHCKDCTVKRWRCNHRKRARLAGVEYESVGRLSIFNRDGWRCQICGCKVRRAKSSSDPRAASIDHIVPLAKGGDHVEANLQCACWECNVKKGARSANDQLRLAVTA